MYGIRFRILNGARLVGLLLLSGAGWADTALLVSDARLRATPPGASVTAGYVSIANPGTTDDRLLGGSAPFAERVEIHETVIQDDVARMVPRAAGLAIPAQSETRLSAGGLHLMFMGLKHPLKPEAQYRVRLEFERAGAIDVRFVVHRPHSAAHTHRPKEGPPQHGAEHRSDAQAPADDSP